MHLVVKFEGHDPREIAVTDLSVVTVEDAVTESILDRFSLDGVASIYLVRTDGSDVVTGPDAKTGPTAEDLARSIGWVPPQEKQDFMLRVGELEEQLAQSQRAVRALEDERTKQEQQANAGRGLFRRS